MARGWMLDAFLVVAMMVPPPEAPVCFDGVIGAGGRQRRLIVEVQSDTTALAHLFSRPMRQVPLVGQPGVKGMRVFRSADNSLTFTPADDGGRVTTSDAGIASEWRIERVPAPVRMESPEEWSTTLGPGGVLRLIMRVRQGPCGTIVGEFDSPDQGQNNLPMTAALVGTDSISVQASYMDLRIAFPRAGDGEERSGTLMQRGLTTAIVLKRGRPGSPRPQEPTRPLPYEERDVAFPSRAPGMRIAGTLTLPRTPGPHPAIVMISGSGAQDRNETIAAHRPFLVLSDRLTRAGYAVLRTDDRGAGETTGQVLASDFEDLAADVHGALDYLQRTNGIDTTRIGLLGHSEGGYVAPIVAATDSRGAFLSLLAASAMSGGEILPAPRAAMSRAAGADTMHARLDSAILGTIVKSLIARSKDDPVEAAVARALNQWMSRLSVRERAVVQSTLERRTPAADSQSFQLWRSRWFNGLLHHDPARYLSRVHRPVFELFGGWDVQVQ